MRILVSNDDGVHAEGLHVLARELKKIAKTVIIVAPEKERSTTGHSLTLHKPLRLDELSKGVYSVNGSPADCVYLGLREIFGSAPDFVVSGINRGSNLGQDVYYSGTVSAAREACVLGIPALSVSLCIDAVVKRVSDSDRLYFESAAKMAVKLLKSIKKNPLPEHTLLNLNVPNLPIGKIKGFMPAKMGFRYYGGKILKRQDNRGKNYYWIGGQYQGFKKEKDTDCVAVNGHYAAITPLQLDVTDYDFLRKLEHEWCE